MKIGILTHPVRCNYGGVLQAYAIQYFLQSKGYESEIIDLHRPDRFLSRMHHWVERNIFHRNFTQFAHQKMLRTSPITTQEALKQVAARYFAIVVGSDQVWRFSMVHGLERNYFLDFAPNTCRRIAYAASFGLSDLELCNESLYDDIKALVLQFDAISVRESDGVDICERHWRVKAIQVLDPTLLIGKNIFKKLADTAKPSKGDLFYYFLGKRDEEVLQLCSLAQKIGKKAFTVNAGRSLRIFKFTFAFYPGIEQWIRAFDDAEVIITDSFHGVCFSLLFNKPFYVIGNKLGGVSRINSILHLFGLNNRFINSLDGFKTFEQLANRNIDYTKINNRLAQLQVDSENFLLKALGR